MATALALAVQMDALHRMEAQPKHSRVLEIHLRERSYNGDMKFHEFGRVQSSFAPKNKVELRNGVLVYLSRTLHVLFRDLANTKYNNLVRPLLVPIPSKPP